MDGELPLLAIQDVQIQIFAFPVCEEEFVEESAGDSPEAAGGEGDGFVDGTIDALDTVLSPALPVMGDAIRRMDAGVNRMAYVGLS